MPEGQGRGIIIGVTRLLLLGPFYTIKTKKEQTFWRGVYVVVVPVKGKEEISKNFVAFSEYNYMNSAGQCSLKIW